MDVYDVIIIGSGIDACEAALASSRIAKTALLSENLDSIVLQEDIGGFSNIREDPLFQQLSEKHAVLPFLIDQDPLIFHRKVKRLLERTRDLNLIQGKAIRIITDSGKVIGVCTAFDTELRCESVVICVDPKSVGIDTNEKTRGVFLTDFAISSMNPVRAAVSGAVAGQEASEYASSGST